MRKNSVRSFPAPRPVNFGQTGWCKWCGLQIPVIIDGKKSTQRMWHPECAHQYNLHTRQAVQKEFLIERDGRRCAMCGAAPERWLADQYEVHTCVESCFGWQDARPGDWQLDYWPRPTGPWEKLTPEEKATGKHLRIERVCALEVDHRIPLWKVADLPDDERRWYFGPGNLWLLCPVCHKTKTKDEAAARASARRKPDRQLPLI